MSLITIVLCPLVLLRRSVVGKEFGGGTCRGLSAEPPNRHALSASPGRVVGPHNAPREC